MTRPQLNLLRRLIEIGAQFIPEAEAVEAPELTEAWKPNKEYKYGKRVTDEVDGELILYKCIIPHTSQADWPPHLVNMWVKAGQGEWPEWIQPTGAADAYPLGAKVSHLDKHWISDYDNNVWEPSVFGWHEEGEEA